MVVIITEYPKKVRHENFLFSNELSRDFFPWVLSLHDGLEEPKDNSLTAGESQLDKAVCNFLDLNLPVVLNVPELEEL